MKYFKKYEAYIAKRISQALVTEIYTREDDEAVYVPDELFFKHEGLEFSIQGEVRFRIIYQKAETFTEPYEEEHSENGFFLGTISIHKGEEELFYDEVNETKSKAETYALMFYVWDYVEWWKEQNGIFTPDETGRTVYAEIADSIGIEVNDRTGRSPKVEKYLEVMNE